MHGVDHCFFAVTLAENFSTFGEIEAVKVQNLYNFCQKLIQILIV